MCAHGSIYQLLPGQPMRLHEKCPYCEVDGMRAALRKALNVWHNYLIDSTEEERAIEEECRALLGSYGGSC